MPRMATATTAAPARNTRRALVAPTAPTAPRLHLPDRYAKPLLDLFAVMMTQRIQTMCAVLGLRVAVEFVFQLEALFVVVVGRLTAPLVQHAVARRAALPLPSPFVAGMKTLVLARSMPFRSQGVTSSAVQLQSPVAGEVEAVGSGSVTTRAFLLMRKLHSRMVRSFPLIR